MERITANGVDFAYLDDGPRDGPLALCLHGFPDHAPTWSGLLPALAAGGFHAVAPWMRGYAPTAVPADGRYQSAALALDALALADGLAGDGDAVIVGHDWGAIAAYNAVAHRPDRFSRAVTLAVPHLAALGLRLFLTPAQLKRSWYMFFFQQPVAEMAVAHDDYAFIEMLWRDWSPGYTPDPSFMRALKDTFAAPGCLTAALDYYRATFQPDRQDPALASVQAAAAAPVPVPALYLHGVDDGCMGADLFTPDELQPSFAKGVEVEVVPGTGHFLHLEAPDVVNRRIIEFLTG
ncbi:MAG TPA: alpha/beta hydrolase [Acidimicrobiales bacterium]|jgi:pimeloyl-ACP methyl ester carboxylesterase|nr:alpha/beta hydrolase [Acidimicrobiales bacterium]